MFNLIQEWESSREPIKSFCRSKGIKSPTFHYWLKKYRHSSKGSFQSVVPSTPAPLTDTTPTATCHYIQISFPNGVSVQVEQGVSISWLQALIHSYDEPTA